MEMLITPTWLRSKFETEPDIDFDAGMPVHLLHSIDMFLPPDVTSDNLVDEKRVLQLKHAFGICIRQLRLRDRMSIDALADAASAYSGDSDHLFWFYSITRSSQRDELIVSL